MTLRRSPLIQAALVTPEIVDQVCCLGQAAEPLEACGIITPDGAVVRVPNVSPEPHRHYQLEAAGLVNAMREYTERANVELSELERGHFIIWHTHPNGEVGPSKVDMRQKVAGFRYLVVAMPAGPASIF
jgi:proteasome lid subunit RPN8/RPN11